MTASTTTTPTTNNIYLNDYKPDYNPDYNPNYKLQCIFPSQYWHLMGKPMMFSITIPTCNGKYHGYPWCFAKLGKISWVPRDVMPTLHNITVGFSTWHTGRIFILWKGISVFQCRAKCLVLVLWISQITVFITSKTSKRQNFCLLLLLKSSDFQMLFS